MQGSDDRIAIASSKVKLILVALGAFLFVALSVWLFMIADTQDRFSSIYVKVLSVLGVVFSGLCGLYCLSKLSDDSPGLVLDSEGIIDNSSAIAAGRVTWQEIRDVQEMVVSGQRFLTVIVQDPGKYLGKGNPLSRLLVKMNYKMYGSPIFISTNGLKVGFDELERLFQDYRDRYGPG